MWSRTNDRQDRDPERQRDEPRLPGARRFASVPRSSTSASSTPKRGCSPTTPASPRPQAARARSPISTVRRASCSTAAIRSTSWPSNSTFMEVSYLLLHGELAEAGRAGPVHLHDQPPHDGARAAGDLLSRLPARRPSDGDHVRRGRRAVRLLPRQHGHHRSRAADDRLAPADRENADAGGDGVQISASASRSSIRTTASATPATSCA